MILLKVTLCSQLAAPNVVMIGFINSKNMHTIFNFFR
nr:MAG TPA: hypothetical protein [Bacteriophage sp.]